MTISSAPAGETLFFSSEDLSAARLDLRSLTDRELFALIRRTLAACSRPLPPLTECTVFPSSCGVLCFVAPAAGNPSDPERISGTFS